MLGSGGEEVGDGEGAGAGAGAGLGGGWGVGVGGDEFGVETVHGGCGYGVFCL